MREVSFMAKDPNQVSSIKLQIEKNTNNIQNQNQQHNIKKEALGPNTRRK